MKSERSSFGKRMIAGASAAFVCFGGGVLSAVAAPAAMAAPADANYIGGSNLSVAYVDSEEKTGESGGNGPAIKAIDGIATTYWHTNWSQGGETPGPHWISLGAYPEETLESCSFTGLEYTQRQGSGGTGAKNGAVKDYEVYVTDQPITDASGFTAESKVKTGTFADTNDPQLVDFGGVKSGQYVTLRAISALSGSQNLTSVGELRLQGTCDAGATLVAPVKPTQSADTATVSIPDLVGVEYRVDGKAVTGEYELSEGVTEVVAVPKDGFKFTGEQSVSYSFEHYGVPVPATIPSLTNDFVRSGGSWTADQSVTVVRPEGFAASAELLIDELNAYTDGTGVTGATSGEGVKIVIDAAQKDALGAEGYTLEVTTDGVTITAAENKGAFWGTRTLSQMLRQSLTLPAGKVTDKPAYSERGVTLCACQINFSTEWIDRFLNEMADLKLNQVLMEMKLKSDQYPVANTFSYYSREDVKKFVEKADSYGIDVIPEINSPGHMNIWLENLPEYQLKNTAGVGSSDRLDITNPDAVKFYKTLIDEYDGVFSTKYWHMGADEYMMGANYGSYPQLAQWAQEKTGNPAATGADAFTLFINDINDYVKDKGKTLRIWNDGIVNTVAVTLDKDIVIEHWLGSGRSARDLAADGYKLMNAHLNLYFSRPSPYPIQANGPGFLYDGDFAADSFAGSSVAAEDMDMVLGTKLSIWPDNGVAQTENEVEIDIYEAMRYVAQINWAGGNPEDNPTYADFKAKRVDQIERSPLWNNVNRKPLEDGLYTISQPAGESLQLVDNAALGGKDEWTLVSTPDHYYQLKNMTTNQCLSVVSGYKHLSTVTQVGARPEARPCVDVSQIYTGNQAGNAGSAERNPQKWMLLPVDETNEKFEVINSVTLQHLAVATGEEDHVDFRTFNGVAKDTKPAAGEVVQFPDDMTDDVWVIKPSERTFTATAVADSAQAYASEDGAGAVTITVTVKNRSDQELRDVVVTPPTKPNWKFDSQPKTIESIPVGETAEVTFTAEPESYLGDADFIFTVSMGDESFTARTEVKAVCGATTSPSVVGVSSEEKTGEGAGSGVKEAAVDGNPSTYWHTQWQGGTPNFPHYIDLQVANDAVDLCGFVYTPRLGQANGRVKDFEIYASAADTVPTNAADWGEPVATGSFTDGTDTQTVALNVKTKYLRFKGLNAQPSVSDAKVMSAAELQVIQGAAGTDQRVEPQEPSYEGLLYTIPSIEGVNYQADGKDVEPGTYEAAVGAKLSFTAKPAEGFFFPDEFYDAAGKFVPWTHTFTKVITPEAPTWDDAKLTYTIPESEYVEYLIGSTVLEPGEHQAEAQYLAHVTAQLKDGVTGVELAADADTAWDHQFPSKSVDPGTDPVDPGTEPGDNPGTEPGAAEDGSGNTVTESDSDDASESGVKPATPQLAPEAVAETDGLPKTGANLLGLLTLAGVLGGAGLLLRRRESVR